MVFGSSKAVFASPSTKGRVNTWKKLGIYKSKCIFFERLVIVYKFRETIIA